MNTIFPPHTLGFACIPTLPAAGCGPAAPAAGNQGAAPQLLSLPGCVPTHTIATVCTQIGCPIGPTGWLGCPGGHTIGYTGWLGCPGSHTIGHTGWHTCPPVTGGGQNTIATVCTQIGCQPHISLPGCIHTGICPPPANGGQAQAQFQPTQTAATTCTQIGCPQPEPHLLSAPPHCPVSPPANGGGQAQAQTFPLTLPPFCPIYTIPPFCPQPTNAGGQAQAQTLPYTHLIGCPNTSTCSPTGQAGGGEQAQTLPHTQAFGCPNTSTCSPVTHAFGCPNTSTCSPVTHALGCPNTSTCSPDTAAGGGQAQAQAFTFFGICPPVPTMNCIPSIPGCIVPTLNCQQAQGGAPGGAQAQTIFPTLLTLPPMCPPFGNAGGQAQTLPHTHLIGCPNTSTCSPTTQAGGGQAQAQTMLPTLVLPCTFIICNQAQGGAQGGAQAQTIWHTQPGYCSLSTPPLCPTVAVCPPANAGQGGAPIVSAATQCPTVPPVCPPTSFNCPPANGGQGPQTNTLVSAYTHCPTVPPMCPPTAPPTCQQPLLSAPPHCPTVAPMCAPANGGGQAQAQGFTFLGICPHTISPVMCVLTQIAGCGA